MLSRRNLISSMIYKFIYLIGSGELKNKDGKPL